MTKKDRLTISSDEILKKAALEAEKEARRQMGNYCSRARELPDDCEAIDEEFLAFARAYDAMHKKPPKKTFAGMNRVARFAAIFIVCIVSAGVITAGVSHAFKYKSFDVVFYQEEGGVSLTPEAPEEDFMAVDIKGYWYPDYLPEGCSLDSYTENKSSTVLYFKNEEQNYDVRLFEYRAKGFSMTNNTRCQTMEKVVIGDSEAYLFYNGEDRYCYVVWQADDRVLTLRADNFTDTEELLKIAKSVTHHN